jgi:hypothetical protein
VLIFLLTFAFAQDADLQALAEKLGHQDAGVREKASTDLASRGVTIVPWILSIHRSSDSPEVRLRTEALLRRFPFPAFALTGPAEPLHDVLKGVLLADLETHRHTPGCWVPEGQRPAIDGARLQIVWQSGSGHGQSLEITTLTSTEGGRISVRRISHQGKTLYRSEVKEGSRIEEMEIDSKDSAALVELLQAGASLRTGCAIKKEEGSSWMSTGSFSMRLRIDSGDIRGFDASYTGYPGSLGLQEYSHGKVLEKVLETVMAGRSWTRSDVLPVDRTRALRWITEHFAVEGWWVKERYLDITRSIGDAAFVPFLSKVAKDLEGNSGASEKRQLQSARAVLSQITQAGK